MQSINITVTGEFAIDIQCCLIHELDARGCKVDHCWSEEVAISERNRDNVISAAGTFNLTYPVLC